MSGKDAIRKHLEAIYGPLPLPNRSPDGDYDSQARREGSHGDVNNCVDAKGGETSANNARDVAINDGSTRCSNQTSASTSAPTASPSSSRILKGAWTKSVAN